MYFIYFFWFTVCTSIIFFPYCKNLYIFFVFVFVFFFFVYNVHINHFFLPFCIVRIYVLFFRIRINVLVVLESIIICFIGYFYNTKWKNMTYTQTKLLRSRVLCEEMQSFNEGGEIKRQKRISEIDLGVISICDFIGNDQWIYSKQRIRIR